MIDKPQFAFIVHSRGRADLPRRFPILRFLPDFLFDFITLHFPPFVVSPITGLKDKNRNPINGLVVGIPMTARQLIENKDKGLRRVVEAVELSKSRGVKYIGLGAMTASLTRGGRDVIDQVKDLYITTGRTYTVKNIIDYVGFCVGKFNLDSSNVKIGIVGAAGGIGSGVAVALARKGYKNFLLIDLERKNLRLKNRIEILEKHATNLKIELSHKVNDVESCQIIIAATSSPEIVIRSEDVSSGTIIINDAQPSDVSPEILNNRSDVMVIEGGVLNAPNMNCHINFGLANKDDIFSCLAETLLVTYLKSEQHHSLDDFDSDLYARLEELSVQLDFNMSIQNDLGIIGKKRLDEFATIVKQRFT